MAGGIRLLVMLVPKNQNYHPLRFLFLKKETFISFIKIIIGNVNVM